MGCNDNGDTRRSRLVRPSLGSVILFDLCRDRIFEANTTVGSALWTDYILTDETFEDLGPGIEDIVVHAEGFDFTANFSYRVVLQKKFVNGPWSPPDGSAAVLVALQTATGYPAPTVYNTRANFGRKVRIVLQTQITAGSSNPQRGNLHLSAAVRMFCT